MNQITANLWEFNREMSLVPGVRLPLRSTLVRLPSGELWLHSPVQMSDDEISQIQQLGDLRYIVAPSKLHHLWFAAARLAFPEAVCLAAPGLAKKRPDLRFDGVLGESESIPGVEQVFIEGMPWINETVFVVQDSLLCADLFMNIDQPRNLLSRAAFKAVGALDQVAIERVFRMAIRDRSAFDRSMKNLLALSFQRLIPCHGGIVEHAKPLCDAAFQRI